MAAVPPPAGRGREAGCRCAADAIATSARARYGGATEAREASVGIEDIAEHAQHTDINTTRKPYLVPSIETSRRVAKQRTSAGWRRRATKRKGKMESLTG